MHTKLNNTHLALMHYSWAMDLDPKVTLLARPPDAPPQGANSQVKDALDPALSRAGQELAEGEAGEEPMVEQHEDFQGQLVELVVLVLVLVFMLGLMLVVQPDTRGDQRGLPAGRGGEPAQLRGAGGRSGHGGQ